ncbi:hypothetical protein RDI58_004284 [Solanum bulbocastanum]|uniref:NAC domain-containing protein n=1 Tax=Solanum bulbocastanum TaxID=147425 RepID=A0AAN8U5A2_SOLBU
MKEYRVSDKILEDLRLHGKILYDDFVVCSIRRKVNSENLLASCSSQCQDSVKSSAANVIPSDQLNSILNGNMIYPVSLVFKESNVTQLPAAVQEQCSVPVVHQETPSLSLLAKEVECSVPVLHQETPSVSFVAKESMCLLQKKKQNALFVRIMTLLLTTKNLMRLIVERKTAVFGLKVSCNATLSTLRHLLFDTTTTIATEYHVFTQLKKKKGNGMNFNWGIVGGGGSWKGIDNVNEEKKKGNGMNFNRGIVGGGGSWKGVDNSRPVYDKKKSVIGFKKNFRFEEKNHVWIMKEYHLCDKILKALRQRGHTRHEEEFDVCRITRSVNSSQFQENKDLGQFFAQSQFQQSSTANVIPSDESNSILNGNIGPVTLVFKESKLSAAIEKECSVPVVHQQTPSVSLLPIEEECSVYDITTYHKELDAYAASVLESMVPYIPQEDEADSIPPFYEDFYIGYTDLWS